VYWRKSSYSSHNGACVEIALIGPVVGVRDSKNSGTGHLAVTTVGWAALVVAVKGDELTPGR
jgi:hypothetical protein